MKHKNLYLFVGTTAELIKLMPVIVELKKRKVDFKIITSGQNEIIFNEFKPVTGDLEIYHSFVVRQLKFKIHPILDFMIWVFRSFILYLRFFGRELNQVKKKNTYFIVHGDTISALMGAAIARIYGVNVFHIESGLRSFNFFEPFPEEICRWFVSRLADVHFCPNDWAVNNLKNINGIKINTKNNTLIESLKMALSIPTKFKILKIPGRQKYFLLILHRQEHIFFQKDLTRRLLNTFVRIGRPNLKCVLVLHNLTEKFLEIENLNRQQKNVILIPRVPYIEFMKIMQKSEFVATDGGSNQEECYYLGKPCLILRNFTERIEGLEQNGILAKGDKNTINNFLKSYEKYNQKPIKNFVSPSKIIVDYLIK